MERLFQDLAAIGLWIDDYTLIQEESVTGEKLPSKFAWVLDGRPGEGGREGRGRRGGRRERETACGRRRRRR